MKSTPRLLSVLVLLSACGIVSAIDRTAKPRLTSDVTPVHYSPRAAIASSPASARSSVNWRRVTPASLSQAAVAGRVGHAVSQGLAGHAIVCGF